MLSRFDTIPERDGWTDGRTELLYQYHASALLCWRAIKIRDWATFRECASSRTHSRYGVPAVVDRQRVTVCWTSWRRTSTAPCLRSTTSTTRDTRRCTTPPGTTASPSWSFSSTPAQVRVFSSQISVDGRNDMLWIRCSFFLQLLGDLWRLRCEMKDTSLTL